MVSTKERRGGSADCVVCCFAVVVELAKRRKGIVGTFVGPNTESKLAGFYDLQTGTSYYG